MVLRHNFHLLCIFSIQSIKTNAGSVLYPVIMVYLSDKTKASLFFLPWSVAWEHVVMLENGKPAGIVLEDYMFSHANPNLILTTH